MLQDSRYKLQDLYFDDPRLKMSVGGRLLVRLISYVAYGILAAVTILFLIGDVSSLRYLGGLFGLFLLERLIYFKKAEKSLARLPAGRVNTAEFLSPASFSILEWALDRSTLAKGNLYLYAVSKLIRRDEIREGLLRMDIKPQDLTAQVDDYLGKSLPVKKEKIELLKQIEKLVLAAFAHALKTGNYQIEPKDIFSGLSATGDETISKILRLFDVDENDLENALIFSRFKSAFSGLKKMPASLAGLIGAPYKARHRVMNRAWTARPTPFLDQFAEDITDSARLEKVGFLIGHEQEYDRLVDVLSRPGRPNALLVGEPGSGKSTLTAHLAFQIIKDRVPKPLFDHRLVKLEIGSLVAGAAEGEIQERIKKILDEIYRAGNIILYIPDIHNLLKTASGRGVSAADVLLPAIKGSAFSVIGATYPREYKEYIEPNSDFASIFELIKVQEISETEAVKFLVYASLLLEKQYKIIISFAALKETVSLSRKYFRDKLLPASAEDLLKETLADAVGNKKKVLTADNIIAVAEKKVNVPIHKAGKAEAEKLLNLEELIHQRLIDQEEAVKAVSRSLREYRSGLSRKGGPIANFLFVGPTGVGKTELSKILAKIQFGSSEMMVRFDMSEYQDKSTVNRLLENVTNSIREKPYSLVLLDEFEKAHPDILNLFLQVFDDGRLTDSLGRTVDFQNTIIIATSNAHSEFIKTEIEHAKSAPPPPAGGFGNANAPTRIDDLEVMSKISEQLKKKLTDYFKPELLNRFSNIIVFKPLSPEDIFAISRIQLADLAATLSESNGVDLQFDETAIREIARLGYDPVFGARPLRNVISEKLRGPLAEKILRGEITRGSVVKALSDNGNIIFKS